MALLPQYTGNKVCGKLTQTASLHQEGPVCGTCRSTEEAKLLLASADGSPFAQLHIAKMPPKSATLKYKSAAASEVGEEAEEENSPGHHQGQEREPKPSALCSHGGLFNHNGFLLGLQ